ncbi:LD-carboxypeptidase [Bacteroidota bacterium]
MNRRDLLKGGLISLALPLIPKIVHSQPDMHGLIKPKALKEGDIVGIIAPGTAVSNPDDIAKVQQALNYFGLKMKLGKYVEKGSGYKSRTIEERIDDLHKMFLDKEVKAVFCIRGGYGSGQLLDKIDYKLIRNNPKIFLGYSDITAMHLAINKLSGLLTFHGPVLLSAFTSYTVDYFKKALFSTEPIGKISNPPIVSGVRPAYPYRTIVSGKAKGKLTGGNLSLISSTMGTPYEIDTKDKILFIEDVGEEPYRIDRMLTQLNLAGKLKEAAGIIFGKCAGCNKSNTGVWDYSLGEVLDYQLGDLNIPVFYGLLIGHTSDQVTLPYNVEAEINTDEGILDILESGVI